MYNKIQQAAPDAILGLTEVFNADSNPAKINLSVGVFKDAEGRTPILESVKYAEKRLLESETSKSYLSIPGDAQYIKNSQKLLLGADHSILKNQRIFSAQTPGGTCALRIAGDFINTHLKNKKIWVTTPTWANHKQIFSTVGLEIEDYAWFDPTTNAINLKAILQDIDKMKEGDIILLHGCCHNPSGADPDQKQWTEIAEKIAEKKLLPLVDFAYQGFGSGITEDTEGLFKILKACPRTIVCTSYSKNFSLYNERVGAVHFICESKEEATRVGSQVKIIIRTNYSNPPAHGGKIVATILADEGLTQMWKDELTAMRNRINSIRIEFVHKLSTMGVDRDFSFIKEQKGMFSFSGLTPEQVARLRDEHSIYIVGNGRINVAGITPSNIDKLCDAIASVL